MTRTRREWLGVLGSVGAVTVAGCAGGESGTGADADTTTATTEPTTTTTADAEGATVAVREHDEYGDYLVDGDGMALYMFDNDTQGDDASTCYDDCATNWPPLVAEDPGTGDGVTATLTTFERDDDGVQVAANGWPLYYFAADEAPGDVNGQAVGDVWWLVSPSGEPIRGAAEADATVAVREHDEYDEILVDSEGMTLYMFDNDTQGEDASVCYDDCATNWPPLVAEDPEAGSGVSATLTTFERDDDGVQVAANGWPLYYFAADEAPGDVNGQAVSDVWWVLDAAGEPVRGSDDGGDYEY